MSTTTNFTFSGNELTAVSFTGVIGTGSYTNTVHWNMAAQRWYITVTSSEGVRMLTRPLIASVSGGVLINLLFGIFDDTYLYWYEDIGIIQLVTE